MATPFASVLRGITAGDERNRQRARQDASDADARELAKLQRDALIAAANERTQAPIRQQQMMGQRLSVLKRQPRFQGYSDDELMGIAQDENAYRGILLESFKQPEKAVMLDQNGKPVVYDKNNPEFPEGFVGQHQQTPKVAAPQQRQTDRGIEEWDASKGQWVVTGRQPYQAPVRQGNRQPRAPTEFQQKMGLVLPNAESAAKRVRSYIDTHGTVPARSLIGKLTLGNYGVSSDEQQFRSAAETLLAAILRPETGAAVTDAEWDKYSKIFIPMPGDKPALIQQKLEEIERRLGAMRAVLPQQSAGGISPNDKPGDIDLRDPPSDGGRAITVNGKTYKVPD